MREVKIKGASSFSVLGADGASNIRESVPLNVKSTPELEKKFVHHVKDAIAPHFSATRFASSSSNILQSEGQNIGRPPFFNGIDFTYWKNQMITYLKATDVEVYKIVTRGPYVLMKTVGETKMPKTEDEWDDDDWKKESSNARALHILYCAIDRIQLGKLRRFSTANELWKLLETFNEGTPQIKESKISRLMSEFDSFKKELHESIEEMASRFISIVNQLHALGRPMSMSEQVKKILRSLPKEFRLCTTSIKESKNLNELQLEDLIGNLIEYEIELDRDIREDKRKKRIALRSFIKKDECSSSNEEDEDELELFKKYLKNQKKEKKKDGRGKQEKEATYLL